MINIKSKGGRLLWMSVYALLIIAMGLIIVLSIVRPQHNLIPWQMAVGTIAGFVCMVAAFLVWDRICSVKRWPYLILLAAYGGSLYIVSCIGRNSPASFVDYDHIWNAAREISEENALSEEAEQYFKLYPNNFRPMLFLSAIFRCAFFLHLKDPFYLVLLFGVAGTMGAVWGG